MWHNDKNNIPFITVETADRKLYINAKEGLKAG